MNKVASFNNSHLREGYIYHLVTDQTVSQTYNQTDSSLK